MLYFQKPSAPQVELSLVMFNSHGSYSGVYCSLYFCIAVSHFQLDEILETNPTLAFIIWFADSAFHYRVFYLL